MANSHAIVRGRGVYHREGQKLLVFVSCLALDVVTKNGRARAALSDCPKSEKNRAVAVGIWYKQDCVVRSRCTRHWGKVLRVVRAADTLCVRID